jgi:hypothetical protein
VKKQNTTVDHAVLEKASIEMSCFRHDECVMDALVRLPSPIGGNGGETVTNQHSARVFARDVSSNLAAI